MGGKFKTMTLIEESELARLRDKEITEYNPSIRSMTNIQTAIEKIFDDPSIPDDAKIKLINTLQEKFNQLYTKFKISASALPNALLAAASAISKNKQTPHAVVPVGAQVANLPTAEIESEEFADAPADLSLATQSVNIQVPSTISQLETKLPGFPTAKEIGLPTQYARKLDQFREFLVQSQNVISPNAKNEIVLDGNPIPASSFSDLMRAMYLRNNSLNLTGFSEFISKLAQLNANSTMFSNAQSIAALEAHYHKSHSKSQDPIQTRKQSSSHKGFGAKRKFKILNSISGIPPGKKPHILHMFRI